MNDGNWEPTESILCSSVNNSTLDFVITNGLSDKLYKANVKSFLWDFGRNINNILKFFVK